jgi:hypothetical protein
MMGIACICQGGDCDPPISIDDKGARCLKCGVTLTAEGFAEVMRSDPVLREKVLSFAALVRECGGIQ